MNHRLVVLCTTPDEATARGIAGFLVERRLAACVNVVGGVRSVYRWRGRVEEQQEFLLVVKTRQERLEALVQAIQTLHPAEVPEVIALRVEGGSERYLAWLDESVE